MKSPSSVHSARTMLTLSMRREVPFTTSAKPA